MIQYPTGDICIDLSGMDKIVEIHGWSRCLHHDGAACSLYYPTEDDGDVVVQAGVPWEDLNQTLKDKGIPLFFPVRSTLQDIAPWLFTLHSLTLDLER